MAKAKIDLRETRALLADAGKRVNLRVSKQTANLILDMMKEMISRGSSPIAGNGRFPAYKNRKKYPGKQKPATPVNLYLTGKFLSQLVAQVSPVRGNIRIGFNSKYGKTLEQGHREGAKGQPSRPIIPEENERLAKPIRAAILELYTNAVRKYLREK